GLREELKVPDAMAMETGPTALMSAESLRKMEASRIETSAELVRQKTVLDMLKGLKYEQLAQVLPTTVQDTLLSSLLEQRALAEQGLVVKLKEYGEQHAEVLKFKGQSPTWRTRSRSAWPASCSRSIAKWRRYRRICRIC